jgi:hypothetical protein
LLMMDGFLESFGKLSHAGEGVSVISYTLIVA